MWVTRLPWNSLSRCVGRLSYIRIPKSLRRPVIRGVARALGADLNDAELPPEAFPTVQDFFVRRLRPGSRPQPECQRIITSPVDAVYSQAGTVESGKITQIKGLSYNLTELIRNRVWADRFINGTYVTLYLQPRDYHRIHAPYTGRLAAVEHVPGLLLTVNQWGVRHVPNLFTVNERVTTFFETDVGPIAVVKIGATSVGSIRLRCCALQTNRPWNSYIYNELDAVAPIISRGDEIARFELGSTVVVLFERGSVSLEPIDAGRRVRVGEPLAFPVE